jgi:hypothetical protein
LRNALFSFNERRIFPKIVIFELSFFIATSFTKKIRIMIAMAPGMSDKRKTACISITCKIANAAKGPAIAPI